MLDAISQIVGAHEPALGAPNGQRKRLTLYGTLAVMASLMIGCVIPVVIGLRPYFPTPESLIVLLAGLAGLVMFGGCSLLIYADALPKAQPPGAPPAPAALPKAPTTNELGPAPIAESMPSVTEHTTRALEPEPGRARRPGE